MIRFYFLSIRSISKERLFSNRKNGDYISTKSGHFLSIWFFCGIIENIISGIFVFMDNFSLKNRIIRDINANHSKLKELIEETEKSMSEWKKEVHIWSASHLILDQTKRKISRLFSELESQESRLKTINLGIVQTFEKAARESESSGQRMDCHDQANYFRGRYRTEVEGIITKRKRIQEIYRKIER